MSDIFGNASSADLTDVVITDSTTKGSFTITTLNNEEYNLQTPNNGVNLDVLTTDGVGNTYWAPAGGGGGTPTLQEVYDASGNPAIINMPSQREIIFNTDDSNIQSKITSSNGIFTDVLNTSYVLGLTSFPSVNFASTYTWSSAPYTFTTSASTTINDDNGARNAWNRFVPGRWVCGNGGYNNITGLPLAGTFTNVNGSPVQGQYLQLEINIAADVGAFYLNGDYQTGGDNGAPVNFQFVGSDDNINYTLMGSYTNQVVNFIGKRYELSVGGSYKYFRIIVTKMTAAPEGRCLIGNMTTLYLFETASINILNKAITMNADYLYSDSFVKNGGTSIQYLMADGSVLTSSANSGNSNFYLYNNTNSTTDTTPINGELIINSAVNTTATMVYISHLTRDNVDVEVFFKFISTLNELYIQDQNLSSSYIQYNITGTPIITINDKVAIPVLYSGNSGGAGATAFGSGHDIMISFFTNTGFY